MTDKIIIGREDYCWKGWSIKFHTCNSDGGVPGDDSRGHDWSIGYKGFNVFYEGKDELTAGEARQLVDMLNRCAIYPVQIEHLPKTPPPDRSPESRK